MKKRLQALFFLFLCSVSMASVSQTKNPGAVSIQSPNKLRVVQKSDNLYWSYTIPGNLLGYDENDYMELQTFQAGIGEAPTNVFIRVEWQFENLTNPGVAPTAVKLEVWEQDASTWRNEVGTPISDSDTTNDTPMLTYIDTMNDLNNIKVRILGYNSSGDTIQVWIDLLEVRYTIPSSGKNKKKTARTAYTKNVFPLQASDDIYFAEYDVPKKTGTYDEADYFEYQDFNFSFPTGAVIGGSGGQPGVFITYEAHDGAGPTEVKLEACDEGDTACIWQNHVLSPTPSATDQTYNFNTTYITRPAEVNGSVYKVRMLGYETSKTRYYIAADYMKVKAKRRIIAGDVTVFGPATQTYYPGSTNNLVLDFKIPDDDGAGDTLNYIYVKNLGTAVDGTDIQTVRACGDAGAPGWQGPPTDTPCGNLTWNGAQSRWQITALSFPIPIGGLRVFIAVDLTANPTDARTLQFQIPVDGIGVASGFGGPTDASVDNPDTQTIDGMIASQITNTSAPAATVNANDTDILAMDFTIQLDGARASDTLNKIRVQNTGTAVDTTDIAAVKAWRESGATPGFQAAQDVLLGSLSWDGTNSWWGNSTNFGYGYTGNTRIYITFNVSANPTDARTVQLNLVNGGSDTDAGIVVASGNDGPIAGQGTVTNANVQTIDGMIASQVTNTGAPTAFLYANETNDLVMNFIVPANGVTADTINTLRVKNAGTAVDTTDIAAVKFWADNGDGSFDPATDTNLGTATWSGVNSWWELTGLTQTTGTSGQRIFTTVDIAASPTAGNTIQLFLPSDPTPGTNAGIQVASGNDGPIDSAVQNANTQTIHEKLTVTPTDLAVPSACIGTVDLEMLKLVLTASSGSITLNSLKVDLTGTAADADIAAVKLWRDNDSSDTINPGDTQLSSTQTFVGGTLTFSAIGQAVTPSGVTLLIGYDGAGGMANGTTAGAKIVDNTYFTVAGPNEDVDSTGLPASSTNTLFGTALVDVTGTDLAPANANASDTDVEMLKLAMTASCTPATVTSIQIDRSGTGTDADLTQATLYEDNGTTANVIDGSDTLIKTCTFATSACTFSGLSLSIPSSPAKNYLVGYDFAAGATCGKSDGASMGSNNSYVTVTGGSATFVNPPIDSSNTLIGQTLQVSGTDKAPTTAEIGATDNLMEQLTLDATVGTITLNSLKIDLSGTGVDADIAGARLFDDVDDDGVLDQPGDTQLSTTQTFATGTLTFSAIGKGTTAGTPENLLVVYDVAGGATAGNTVGQMITDRTYLTVSGGSCVEDFATIQSSNTEIHHTLTVTGTDKATFTDVTKGQTNAVFEQLTLSSSSGTFTVDTIKVDKLGTAADADIAAVKLYDDVDDDGVLDLPGDTQLSTTQTFSGGTLTFTAIGKSVTAGTDENLLVVLDIASGATAGNTIGVTLVDNTYLTVNPSAGTTITFVASPISSSTKTIKNPASLTASFAVPSGPVTYNTNQNFPVTLRVSNCTTCSAATSVAPSPTDVCANYTVVSGTPSASLVSGPTPASATIADGGTQDYSYTCKALTAGVLYLSGGASGTESNLGTPVTAAAANTPNITINNQVSESWSFSDGGQTLGFSNAGTGRTGAGGNSVIFIGNDNGKVYKIKMSDGTKLWSYDTGCGTGVKAPMRWNANVIYFGDECGSLHAVQDTGTSSYTSLWSVAVSGSAIRSGIVMAAISGETRLYFGDQGGTLYCKDAADGSTCNSTAWSDATGLGAISSTPARVFDGYIFAASETGNIYRIDENTGTVATTFTGYTKVTAPLVVYPNLYCSAVPTIAGSCIFIGAWDNTFYLLDSADPPGSEQVWSFSPASPVAAQEFAAGTFVTVAGATLQSVYVGNNNGSFYKINWQTGTQIWKYPSGSNTLPNAIQTVPLILGSKVYFGADDKKWYRLTDSGSSATLDSGYPASASGVFTGAPTIRGGVLTIGNADNKLRGYPQ